MYTGSDYMNYHHSLLSISSMFLKRFNKPYFYKPLSFDISKYNKFILVLMDGYGYYNMDKNCYLYDKIVDVVDSVYPTTTVACTNALRTGKSPYETGWIGWYQYFKEYDEYYTMFLNKEFFKGTPSPKLITDIVPLDFFYHHLNIPFYDIFPEFAYPHLKSFQEQMDYAVKLTRQHDQCFIYIYQDQLDSLEHHYGIDRQEVKDYEKYINDVCKNIKIDDDTLVVLAADHGHINIEGIYMNDYQEIIDCLRLKPTLEKRAMAFYIYEDKKEQFEYYFNLYLGKYYKLYSKEEVYKNNLLGYNHRHHRVDDFIGDYLAVALTNKTLYFDDLKLNKGDHAGFTKEEMKVPVIFLTK